MPSAGQVGDRPRPRRHASPTRCQRARYAERPGSRAAAAVARAPRRARPAWRRRHTRDRACPAREARTCNTPGATDRSGGAHIAGVRGSAGFEPVPSGPEGAFSSASSRPLGSSCVLGPCVTTRSLDFPSPSGPRRQVPDSRRAPAATSDSAAALPSSNARQVVHRRRPAGEPGLDASAAAPLPDAIIGTGPEARNPERSPKSTGPGVRAGWRTPARP